MGAADGAVGALVKIVDAGTTSGKWNLVIVAEGYQAGVQQRMFITHASQFAATLLATPPFDVMAAAINIFRLETTSSDEGADDPAGCADEPGTGAVAKTLFDASFCNSNRRRMLLVDTKAVVLAVKAALPAFDAIAVIVNSTIPGGSADGQVATFSRGGDAHHTGLHELGHSAFGLGDEYSEGPGNHSHHEPSAPNLTVQKRLEDLKWAAFVQNSTQIPTETNPNCRKSAVTPAVPGAIGTYEGARHVDCRVYRPAPDCKMRTVTKPFCAVCSAHIKAELSRQLLLP